MLLKMETERSDQPTPRMTGLGEGELIGGNSPTETPSKIEQPTNQALQVKGDQAKTERVGSIQEPMIQLESEMLPLGAEIQADTVGSDDQRETQGSADQKEDPVVPLAKPLADWLAPLGDGDNGDTDSEMESDGEKRFPLKKRKRQLELGEGWVDCLPLGPGWKRREVERRSGVLQTKRKSDTYYISPEGEKMRSKVELAKHLTVDLTNFNYKSGVFIDEIHRNKLKDLPHLEDGVHSEQSINSETTEIADPDSTHTPNGLPGTPRSNPPRSPSLLPGTFSPQRHSTVASPTRDPVIPLLLPLSPTRSPEKQNDIIVALRQDVGILKSSSKVLNGHSHSQEAKSHNGCANCGCSFPGMEAGTEALCPTCRPEKKQPPSIVFRKLQQGWAASIKHPEQPTTIYTCLAPSGYKEGVIPLKDREWLPCGRCRDCRQVKDCGVCASCCHRQKVPKKDFRCLKRTCLHPIYKVGEDKWVVGRSKVKQEESTEQILGKKKKVLPLRESISRRAKMAQQDKEESEEESKEELKKMPMKVSKEVFKKEPKPEKPKKDPEKNKKEPEKPKKEPEKPKKEPEKPKKEPEKPKKESKEESVITHGKQSNLTDDSESEETEDKQAYRCKKRRNLCCKKCEGCLHKECGKCIYCKDKPKFGGNNTKKQKCLLRTCLVIQGRKNIPKCFSKSPPSSMEGGHRGPGRPKQTHFKRRRRKRHVSSDETTEDDEDEEDEEITPIKRRSGVESPETGHADWTPLQERDYDEDNVGDEDVLTQQMQQVTPYLFVNQELDYQRPLFSNNTYIQNCYQGNRGNIQMVKLNTNQFPPGVLGPTPQVLVVNNNRLPPQHLAPPVLYPAFGLPTVRYLNVPPPPPPPSLQPEPAEEFAPLDFTEYEDEGVEEMDIVEMEVELEESPVKTRIFDSPMVIPKAMPKLSPVRHITPHVICHDIGKVTSREVTQQVILDVTPEAICEVTPDDTPYDFPVITQIFSLAKTIETEDEKEMALLRLLKALRKTVLPAHWVGVMAKGPHLQLLQCSKLSTMADTVLQIEPGFFYQISVQGQPLLLTHPLYEAHPPCFAEVSQVVSLLLDMEALAVCQGFPLRAPQRDREPVLYVRAAACQLLVPQTEERCEQCQDTLPEEEEEEEEEKEEEEDEEELD